VPVSRDSIGVRCSMVSAGHAGASVPAGSGSSGAPTVVRCARLVSRCSGATRRAAFASLLRARAWMGAARVGVAVSAARRLRHRYVASAVLAGRHHQGMGVDSRRRVDSSVGVVGIGGFVSDLLGGVCLAGCRGDRRCGLGRASVPAFSLDVWCGRLDGCCFLRRFVYSSVVGVGIGGYRWDLLRGVAGSCLDGCCESRPRCPQRVASGTGALLPRSVWGAAAWMGVGSSSVRLFVRRGSRHRRVPVELPSRDCRLVSAWMGADVACVAASRLRHEWKAHWMCGAVPAWMGVGPSSVRSFVRRRCRHRRVRV